MMFWRRRKIAKDLKTVTEFAGDQIIAPGAGTLLLVLGGLAVAGTTAYFMAKAHGNKKAAPGASAQQGGHEPDRQR